MEHVSENGSTGAHPRSRGEHSISLIFSSIALGSSPLARGTRVNVHIPGLRNGLIPARAGNTHPTESTRSRPRAHPRSRGEHISWAISALRCGGSSPLARGTPFNEGVKIVGAGLIPARAGNTTTRCIVPCFCRAHPRSRGEHSQEGRGGTHRGGSSPLARGTRTKSSPWHDHEGLIPARAGNTKSRARSRPTKWAHPRSRGEHFSTV